MRQKTSKTRRPLSTSPRGQGVSCCAFAEDFYATSLKCTDSAHLSDLLEAATYDLGFRHFALLHHERLYRPGSALIRLDNYPSTWETRLKQNLRGSPDPVHQASARSHTGFFWHELGQIIELESAHIDTLAQARHFGLRHGFTRPVNVPGEPRGSCSFAGRRSASSYGIRQAAELIGGYAFEAARRIYGFANNGVHPHLSRRELECLRLLAAGKTDREIAMILNLSPETVHQYVKRARAAYDVVSRGQLVSRGLRDCVLAYDDRINLGK